MSWLESEAHLDEFLRRLEQHTLPKSEWTHAAHVTMAAGYLTRMTPGEALPLIRDRIKSYNVSVGGENTESSGYHESLTVLWIRLVAHHLSGLDPAMARIDQVRSAVAGFAGRSGIFREYWSFDVVKSVEARREWVEPDLKPGPDGFGFTGAP